MSLPIPENSAQAAALAYYAAEAECDKITVGTETASEFSMLWLLSFGYCMLAIMLVSMPLFCFWLKKRRAAAGNQEDRLSSSDQAVDNDLQQQSAQMQMLQEMELDPKPDVVKANLHLRKTSPTDHNYQWRSILKVSNADIATIGGIGTQMYFQLLRDLGILFLLMSGVTCPIPIFSMVGNFVPAHLSNLAKTTVGNLGDMPTGGLDPARRLSIAGCQGVELANLTKYFGWLDLFAVFLYLSYLAYFRFVKLPKQAKEEDDSHVTPKDFTIEIDCLPAQVENQEKYAELLREHVKTRLDEVREKVKGGFRNPVPKVRPASEVMEISLVRDRGGRLSNIKYRAILLQRKKVLEYKNDTKALAKLEEDIEKVNKKLGTAMLSDGRLPVVRAYVTLNSTYDVQDILHDYRFGAFSLFRCCQGQAKRFQGKAIRVRKAPDPTNITWENQDVGYTERLTRRSITSCVFVIVLLISSILLFICSSATSTLSKSYNIYLGHSACDPTGTSYEIDLFEKKGERYKCMEPIALRWSQEFAESQRMAGNQDVVDCWCAVRGVQKIAELDAGSTCSDWLTDQGKAFGISYVASFIVVGINVIANFIFMTCARAERHHSVSSMNTSMMLKLASAQIINTAIIGLVISFKWPKMFDVILGWIPLSDIMFHGIFPDFVRGWYSSVGTVLLMNLLINAFVPAVSNVSRIILNMFKRWWQTSRKKHQSELLQLYTNPDFVVHARYAQIMTTVYCTMLYSSGMPLLYLLAAAFMFMTYWADKMRLVWGSKRPPLYDSELPKMVSQLLLYAAFAHCLFAIPMLGQPCSVPSAKLGGGLASLQEDATRASRGGAIIEFLSARVGRESIWMLFGLLVVMVALWVLWTVIWIFGSTFGQLWNVLRAICCPRRLKTSPETDAASRMDWQQAKIHIEKRCPPASYLLERSRGYEDVKGFLQVVVCANGSVSRQKQQEELAGG